MAFLLPSRSFAYYKITARPIFKVKSNSLGTFFDFNSTQPLFTEMPSNSETTRQRKIGLASEIVAKEKESGVRFKESEYHAQLQVKLLTFRFGSYGLLGLVLGLPWVMAFAIVFSETSDDLWYPFVVFQGLQVF